MIVLGLQFGHDGCVSVIKDGVILSNIVRERECRIKHALGITSNEIEKALSEAGVAVSDIDYCVINSTQGVELFIGFIDDFDISYDLHPRHEAPDSLRKILLDGGCDPEQHFAHDVTNHFKQGGNDYFLSAIEMMCTPEQLEQIKNEKVKRVGSLNKYTSLGEWSQEKPLREIVHVDLQPILGAEEMQYGFHYPVTVTLQGHQIPGYLVDHHIAHAASSYYRSGFQEAAILTHDGHTSHSGLMFRGTGNKINVLWPHHLILGIIYDLVASHLNLGSVGGAGKLMGLAPYGKPRFFNPSMVGNKHDMTQSLGPDVMTQWTTFCKQMAEVKGYDMSAFADPKRITEPINADIAASTQKLFEESLLQVVYYMHMMLIKNGLASSNLCMSGGTALNCPANSKLFNESPFNNIYIEPSCGDDGLAVGSALYVYHHLYNNPLVDREERYVSPYQGAEIKEDQIIHALEGADAVAFEKISDVPAQAAQDLQDNKVIAWFEGKSEDGPRALGHRSILANPTYAENWERVNEIKGRENWRPFAPAVLEEEADKWFAGVPSLSPYMLFNARVKSDQLPAITHVDGSSRIQTVDESCGEYYKVIEEFFALSGVPVIMNTSFNGPGEPIVETPEQAITFLQRTQLYALYIQGYKVTKKASVEKAA